MKKKQPTKKAASLSSKEKKTLKKKVVAHIQAPPPPPPVQDEGYWISRLIDDVKRDWGYGGSTWVEDYILSKEHAHRSLIIDALKSFEWSYLLEVGCCAGPNLKLIRENFPDKALFGIDVSSDAIDAAKEFLQDNTELQVGDLRVLPYADSYFDVVLADATLMYVHAANIEKAMNELTRVTKKAIIIVDRFNESEVGKAEYVWARNYKALLQDCGFTVAEVKITKTLWPSSPKWQEDGYMWIGLK